MVPDFAMQDCFPASANSLDNPVEFFLFSNFTRASYTLYNIFEHTDYNSPRSG